MTFVLLINHFCHAFTLLHEKVGNSLSQTTFPHNFLPDYLFWLLLTSIYSYTIIFFFAQGGDKACRQNGWWGAWLDEPPWIRHWLQLTHVTSGTFVKKYGDGRNQTIEVNGGNKWGKHRRFSIIGARVWAAPTPSMRLWQAGWCLLYGLLKLPNSFFH